MERDVTTQLVTQEETCRFHNYEVGFVWQIDFEFLRAAKRANLSIFQTLELALRPLRGVLKAHLERQPHPECYNQMATIVGIRFNNVSCVPWAAIVESAAGPSGLNPVIKLTTEHVRHLTHCSHCQRDRRLVRAALPNYEEFGDVR